MNNFLKSLFYWKGTIERKQYVLGILSTYGLWFLSCFIMGVFLGFFIQAFHDQGNVQNNIAYIHSLNLDNNN